MNGNPLFNAGARQGADVDGDYRYSLHRIWDDTLRVPGNRSSNLVPPGKTLTGMIGRVAPCFLISSCLTYLLVVTVADQQGVANGDRGSSPRVPTILRVNNDQITACTHGRQMVHA